jgi:signal transduction histidine kinase/ligand-binding sensor domain-containing protein
LIVLSGLILLSSQATGQRIISHLGKEKLPAPERIAFVTKSSTGFYYLGNTSGLTIYDGHVAELLNINDPNSPVLHDQMVQSRMYEDFTGLLWFSTYSALHAYNEIDRRFYTFQLTIDGQPIQENYHVFYRDPSSSKIWLKAGDYLWAFDCRTHQFERLGGPTLGYRYLVREDTTGARQIIGCPFIYRSGLEIFNLRPGIQNPPRVLDFPQKITAVASINHQHLLLGSTTGLLELRLKEDDFTITPVSDSLLNGPIWDLAQTLGQDTIWISRLDTGLVAYSPSTREILDVITVNEGLSTNDPRDLLITPQGMLWATNYSNGVDLIMLASSRISQPVDLLNQELKSIASVTDGPLFAASNKNVWQTTNQQSFSKWEKITTPTGTPHPPYNSKFFSAHGKLYLQGQRQLWRYRSQTNEWEAYPRRDYLIKGMMIGPADEFLSLSDQGLQVCQEKADTLLCQTSSTFSPEATNKFLGLFQLTDSTFLLSWRGTEAWIGAIRNHNYTLVERIIVPGEIQATLTKPGSNEVYVGGARGLFLLQDGRSIPIKLGHLEGSNINVEALTYDKTGKIWIGTRNGLYCYDPERQTTIYFSTADGLPSDRFTEASPVHVGDSIMMLTNIGSFFFSPINLKPSTSELAPYLLAVRVNDREVDPSTGLFDLPYRRNTLDFRVANVGLHQEGHSAIQYQLLGYESNPISIPAYTTIRYPNLPPGNYTLQLTAINRNGLPSGKKSLDITINPPVTQTLTFSILCTCALALFAIGLYILGLRRERHKQQRLQEQQTRLAAERDRIAGEVHDDLGGQISSILYLSEEMLLTGDTPEYEYELSRINELSRSSLQNVRDIIFALDNRRATLSALGEQLMGAGEAFFGDRKISFQNTEKYNQPDFVLTSRQKRNLTLIVKEAWHNIAKHAKATVVTLDIQEVDRKLVITVVDNGVGFTSSTSDNGMGGYGLDNMQEKVTVIGGQLTIDSSPGQGTSLQITWPLPTPNK